MGGYAICIHVILLPISYMVALVALEQSYMTAAVALKQAQNYG